MNCIIAELLLNVQKNYVNCENHNQRSISKPFAREEKSNWNLHSKQGATAGRKNACRKKLGADPNSRGHSSDLKKKNKM